MIVVLTAEAEADLERIGDHIAERNPARAITFVDELRARCERLADAPQAFPLVARYQKTGLRRRMYSNYLIFYRIGELSIDVIHILHGAMDYEPLLFPEG